MAGWEEGLVNAPLIMKIEVHLKAGSSAHASRPLRVGFLLISIHRSLVTVCLFEFDCVELRLLGIVGGNVFFIHDECFEPIL